MHIAHGRARTTQLTYALLDTPLMLASPVRNTERTKSVARPLAVAHVGVHLFPVLLRPFVHRDVHVDDALLLHVRQPPASLDEAPLPLRSSSLYDSSVRSHIRRRVDAIVATVCATKQ
jgi:hypothetical protein